MWDLPSPASDDAEVDVKNERLMGELKVGTICGKHYKTLADGFNNFVDEHWRGRV